MGHMGAWDNLRISYCSLVVCQVASVKPGFSLGEQREINYFTRETRFLDRRSRDTKSFVLTLGGVRKGTRWLLLATPAAQPTILIHRGKICI